MFCHAAFLSEFAAANIGKQISWIILQIQHFCLSNAMHGQNINLPVCVCVCVSVTLSVNSPTGQTPQRIFTVDSLKDADLRKDVPFGVSMMNNHI